MNALKKVIFFLTEIINSVHDIILVITNDVLGLNLNDKDLHFWIMGMIGISVFLLVYGLSKWMLKLPFGLTLLTFFYTLTFMFVLVFAVEIQQAITNRGNMEFIDAIVGLWGFFVFFIGYVAIVLLFLLSKKLYHHYVKKESIEQ
ncbi:hypothetical protein [Bacillus sp. 2205SS5-2]|uniref:hypothetical protein n=1 Tax=Bacillus sp. 2205SS5-2 TaxID=3109031 RepID=UPI0030044DF4